MVGLSVPQPDKVANPYLIHLNAIGPLICNSSPEHIPTNNDKTIRLLYLQSFRELLLIILDL